MDKVRKTNFVAEMVTRKLRVVTAIAAVALGFVVGGAPAAFAGDFVCTGTVGAVSIDQNVVVPDGRTCALNGTRIDGNVFVLTRATLSASGVRVNGNIQAEGARAVFVNPGSVVGGSIQIVQGGSARIDRVRINADLQFFENRGAIRATQNRIGSNLQVDENTGGVTLIRNVIAQNMQCKQNNPPPTGFGNIAGDKQDQCAGL